MRIVEQDQATCTVELGVGDVAIIVSVERKRPAFIGPLRDGDLTRLSGWLEREPALALLVAHAVKVLCPDVEVGASIAEIMERAAEGDSDAG
jgi:hypothetical protein